MQQLRPAFIHCQPGRKEIRFGSANSLPPLPPSISDVDYTLWDRLCGLVVRVLGYRSGGPGSIPGTNPKKKVMGLERGALSLMSTTEELTMWHPLSAKVGNHFADKRRSLADPDHGVSLFVVIHCV
jgi:hypothetical protein